MPATTASPSRPARVTVRSAPSASPNLPPRGAPSRRNGPPPKSGGPKSEHEILFQRFFKSVGPRTYAAQVKKATNGNHYVVLTEGQRDDKSGDVRKTRLFVFSEDFESFFDLLRDAAQFVKAHPLPPDVQKKRERFWAKQAAGAHTPSGKPRSNSPGPSRPTIAPFHARAAR